MLRSWLIDEDAARQLRDARRLSLKPSDAQIVAFEERGRAEARDNADLPRIMRVAGSVAEVRVEGVLTKTPDILAFFFGGGNTTYTSIIASLAIAKSDPAIKSAVLYVDSPGGTVDGLFDTLAAIEMFRAVKPLTVKAANALSAAYGIAAAAGKIEALNAAARFGSVGVAASYAFSTDEEIVDITNTDSPDKRPDVTTDEGKAVVRRELDAIHDLFVDSIARGRELDGKVVREDFGRGATLLAGEAKKRGMIDAVAKPGALRAVGTTSKIGASADDQKETKMDLRTLKAQHPDIYDLACADGTKAERDRVVAHLTMGQTGGEEGLKIALAAVEAGTDMNMTSLAKYQAVALNQRDRTLRQQDDKQVGEAADGAKKAAEAKAEVKEPDLGDQVVSILRGMKGGK
jgi:ClpP class serine protease